MYCFAGSITQLENYYAKGSRIIILSNYENNSDLSHIFCFEIFEVLHV